jgi:chorismate mutase
MKVFKRTAGYTRFDHKRNEEILEQLKVGVDKEQEDTNQIAHNM